MTDSIISDERLTEIKRGDWKGGSYASLDEQTAMASELIALRARSRNDGLRVKALEWEHGEAQAPYGLYSLRKGSQGRWEVLLNRAQISGSYEQEREAMDAAQRDLERCIRSALEPTPSEPTERDGKADAPPTINDEMAILARLAEGDEIVFSRDGDEAWFSKGDRAWVGKSILSLRAKGYLHREFHGEEFSDVIEYDTISDEGRAALIAASNARGG